MAGKKKEDNKKSDGGKGKDAKGGKKGGGDDKSKDNNKDKSGGGAKGAQSINVRHILCEKHSKKEEALAKLRDGAKFDEVARDFSEDKARQGGALGWKTKGSLAPEFEAVAYGLDTSTTGNPKIGEAKTEHGYHIIMVEGRK
ncbi:peptidyl-prolyl cis-trans isomerase PIN4 [Echria macrotheca]|uniref:Peptidyl-prolyl cis-trans isomerase n=1 Tax=Echria macrotheca TaxID=438768 RepID=A0AAJ0F5Q2_9PEZI|nr:peptidyl-prolyl cis-trans isomerase PIN4 [Echria macrotheca]